MTKIIHQIKVNNKINITIESKHFSRIHKNTSEENIKKLKKAAKKINKALSDYPNFDGIDFCDVGANGIQIRGHHKQIEKYTYGNQPTIKYDFSNIESATQEFIEDWEKIDNPENIKGFKKFIADGERWGWD